jgi:hypothetical protein
MITTTAVTITAMKTTLVDSITPWLLSLLGFLTVKKRVPVVVLEVAEVTVAVVVVVVVVMVMVVVVVVVAVDVVVVSVVVVFVTVNVVIVEVVDCVVGVEVVTDVVEVLDWHSRSDVDDGATISSWGTQFG